MINLGAIAMAVSGCRPQLVDCCLLALNIFEFVRQSCCNSTIMASCRLSSGWQCRIAGSVAGEKLFLSQTFFVLQSFITRSKARAPVMLLPWSRDAVMP